MQGIIDSMKENIKIIDAKNTIKEVYLDNETPWVIGYSGGKDSTVVTQLIFEALSELPKQQLTKKVYIISSDTLVETPPVIIQIINNMKLMKKEADKRGLPFETHIVKPLGNQTFWANIIGRGYPSPNQTFRWCTDRMKIDPANRFIKEMVSEFGEAIMVLGVREGESSSRDRVMANHSIGGKKLMKHTTLTNAFVFPPIKNFTVDDVWDYLLNTPSPWGADNYELYKLYADSSSMECPLVIDKETKDKAGSCGNSRFGCWTCTVVNEDKALTGFIESGEEWLRPLLKFRNWLTDIRDDRTMRMKRRTAGGVYFSPIVKLGNKFIIPKKSKREQITIQLINQKWIDQNNKIWNVFDSIKEAQKYIKEEKLDLDSSIDPRIITNMGDDTFGQLGLGPYTFKARQTILEKLLILQRDIEKELELISKDELFEIRKIWLENTDLEDSVQKLYVKVFGEPLDWQSDDIPLLNDEQLDKLHQLCEKNDLNFTLLKSLISIEKDHLGNIIRRKAVKDISSVLNMDYLHMGE